MMVQEKQVLTVSTSSRKMLICSLKCIVIIVLSLIQLCIARAQFVAHYDQQPFGASARAVALAQAYVGETHDASAMYSNPAALGFLQRMAVEIDHSDEWTNRIMNDRLTVPVSVGSEFTLGLGVTLSHVGYLRESPMHFEGQLFGFDIGSAAIVMPGLSVGVRTNLVYGWSEKSGTIAGNGAVGILYAPYPEVSYGITYSGIGQGPVFYSSGTETTLDKVQLTRKLHLGASMRFPAPPRPTVVALSLTNEKTFGLNGLSYRGGLELFPLPFVGLRFGYTLHPNFAAATYGIGIRLLPIQVDYAILPSRLTNRMHQVTISHDLGFVSE
jgi:hypothetical protein